MEIQKLLETTIKRDASDLHLVVGALPTLRVDGRLKAIEGMDILTPKKIEALVFSLVTDEQKDILLNNKEVDFSFALGEIARFRVNAYYQKGYIAAALRLIPSRIRSMEELGLPKICQNFTRLPQGLVLVTGPTGHGKSTTLAATINEINKNRSCHIVTIEDPVEFVFPPIKSIISQREMRSDTHSWQVALRSVLREDPDVVLIGEMRDFETISSAMTIAETGHLVFATLHTNSAAQTVDRIVDVFPEDQQNQIRLQLSSILEAVFSQRLISGLAGGRVVAHEIMLGTTAIKTAIREGKTHQIDSIIQTSQEVGMATLEHSLASLVKTGKISIETAEMWSVRPEELNRLVKGSI